MLKRKLFVDMKSTQWSNEDTMKWMAHYAHLELSSSLDGPSLHYLSQTSQRQGVTLVSTKSLENKKQQKHTSKMEIALLMRENWYFQVHEFQNVQVTLPEGWGVWSSFIQHWWSHTLRPVSSVQRWLFTTRETWTYFRESRQRPWRQCRDKNTFPTKRAWESCDYSALTSGGQKAQGDLVNVKHPKAGCKKSKASLCSLGYNSELLLALG